MTASNINTARSQQPHGEDEPSKIFHLLQRHGLATTSSSSGIGAQYARLGECGRDWAKKESVAFAGGVLEDWLGRTWPLRNDL